MARHLQPAVDRLKGVSEEDRREECCDKLDGDIQLDAYISQIFPDGDRD